MGSLRELLKKHKITMPLLYSNNQNSCLQWEAKTIVNYEGLFREYFQNNHLGGLNTFEDYYHYLFSNKLIGLQFDHSFFLEDDYREALLRIADDAKQSISDVTRADVIKFINSNYRTIFEGDEAVKAGYDLFYETVVLVAKNIAGINKEVREYLCSYQQYLIVELFGSFEKIMERHPELFERLFPTGHLGTDYPSRIKKVLGIWQRILKKQKSNLKEIVQKRVNDYYEDLTNECDTIQGRSIVLFSFQVDEFNAFLKTTKNSKANDFLSTVEKTENLLSRYIEEHGFSRDIPLDMSGLERVWNKTENPMVRLLAITHDLEKENGEPVVKSRLNNYYESHNSIFDLVQTRSPKDSFYTAEHQEKLALIEPMETAMVLQVLLTPNMYAEYSDLVFGSASFIENHLEAEGDQLSFCVQILFQMLRNMIDNIREEKLDAIVGMCYGPAMYSCALLEKFLRVFYKWLARNDKYIPENQAGLGELLGPGNSYLNGAFGEIHIKNLRFFLLQSLESRAGQNLRNELAHLTITPKSATPILVAKCMWLFTDVLNSIFLFCADDVDKTKK